MRCAGMLRLAWAARNRQQVRAASVVGHLTTLGSSHAVQPQDNVTCSQLRSHLISSSRPAAAARAIMSPFGGPPPCARFMSGGGLGAMAAGMLQNNQFASGGLTLMAVGLTAASLKTVLDWAVEWAKRKLFVRMEIDSRDDAYRWVMAWLARHPEFHQSPRVSVVTSLQAFGTSGLEGSLVGSNKVMFVPAPGEHLLRHDNHWVWISRRRTPGNPSASFSAKLLPETLVVTVLGRNRRVLEDILSSSARAYEADTRQRTAVYSMDATSPYWTRVGSRPIRPLSTVFLPDNQADALLADAREFLASEAWYAHHGIPYRRGYILYGIPGSGKTSLAMALAGALALDVYVVTLSSPSMTDDTLRSLLNSAADRCVLLLEDVDAAFVGRTGQEASSALTFSGLLNAIDGVAAQEGRLLFMTTNHINRLSSALIRPGRVDVRCHLGYATREQIQQMFLAFYTHPPPADAATPPAADAVAPPSTDTTVSAADTTTPPTATRPAPSGGQVAGSTARAAAGPTGHADHLVAAQNLGRAHEATDSSSGDANGILHSQSGVSSSSSPGGDAPAQRLPSMSGGHGAMPVSCPRCAVSAPAGRPAGSGREAGDSTVLLQLAERFAAAVPEQLVSMAAVQGYLMRHKHNPEGALSGAAGWVQSVQQGGGGSSGGSGPSSPTAAAAEGAEISL